MGFVQFFAKISMIACFFHLASTLTNTKDMLNIDFY